MHRTAWAVQDSPWVIKIPRGELGKAANLAEADRWLNRHQLGVADWLAPLIDYDPDGEWLVMARAEPVMKTPRHPESVKRLGDTHRPAQWGLIDGLPKLVDYGLVPMNARKKRC